MMFLHFWADLRYRSQKPTTSNLGNVGTMKSHDFEKGKKGPATSYTVHSRGFTVAVCSERHYDFGDRAESGGAVRHSDHRVGRRLPALLQAIRAAVAHRRGHRWR